MKKYILIFLILLSATVNTFAQKMSDDNFIYTAKPRKATQASALSALAKTDLTQNVTYFDGLGRPIQTIGIGQGGGANPSNTDIVTHIEYDVFGRQEKEYLPYALANTGNDYLKTGAASATLNYYAAKYPAEIVTPAFNAFSQKAFDSSPLNRVIKQAAPGNDWRLGGGHEVKMEYQTNVANEVKLFTATATWDSTSGLYAIAFINGGSYYSAGQLNKTVIYDENTAATPSEINGSTVEFKNKEGQIVLKRTYEATVKHDTYYVYDSYGNLTYVIPPKADATITAAVLNDLCYQYKYDNRNRLVEKKLPGKQWEFIVYDKLDRVVATGPANSPFSDLTSVGWIITKYDAFNRPVYTGWSTTTAATTAGRTTLQTAQNSTSLTILNESKQTSGTIDGIAAYYTNAVAPTSFKLLTVNYYDNYTFPSTPSITVPTIIEGQNVLSTSQIKGLSAATWVRVPTTSTVLAGETTATFYDNMVRPIRTYKINYLGGYTYTDTKLDFLGKPEYVITKHKKIASSSEVTIKDTYTYSAQDRLLTQTHQINGGTVELLASNTYDDLGQLTSKKVGNIVTAPTQNVNYTYNVRGWLSGINDINSLTKSGDPQDLFAFKINYNAPTTGISGVASLYNGNISETLWATNSDNGIIRSYGYKYDNLNRLKEGVFKKGTTISNAYNETLTYDKNGNILTLIRNGDSETATQIDNLVYSYDAGNKLAKVVDNAPTASKAAGFRDSDLNTVDDYSYDSNGNITKDNNKNITSITYNHLNLPIKIVFFVASSNQTPSIEYIYNALGERTQKIIYSKTAGQDDIRTFDYLDGFQYESLVSPVQGSFASKLLFFPTAEGYVEPNGSSFKYVYQYKDHLGNIRLSYDKSLVIQEENNFYPFGLKQSGYNNVINSSSGALKYKYNGKELQQELSLNLYDYGARNYDPVLGRWMNIDLLAEQGRRWSPYNYAMDNPVYFIDPDGMWPWPSWNSVKQFASGFVSTVGSAIKSAATPLSGYSAKDAIKAGASMANGDSKSSFKTIVNATGNATGIPATIKTIKQAANGDAKAIGSVTAIVVMAVVTHKAGGSKASASAESATMESLSNTVKTTASELKATGKAPSVVVGAELEGQTAIASSGAPPTNVAPQLVEATAEMGGVGTKTASGNTIGCCAEFQAANKLLLDNPSATPGQINFTEAIRPRTGQTVPMCENCKTTFGQ